MNKKRHSLLFSIGSFISIEEEIRNFQKTTNNIDHLLNEINLNLNHQNRVSQPT